MNIERVLTRLRKIFLLLGGSLSIVGAVLMGASIYAGRASSLAAVEASISTCEPGTACGPVQYAADPSVESLASLAGTSTAASSETPPPKSKDQATVDLWPQPEAVPANQPARLVTQTPVSSSPVVTQTTVSLSRLVPPTPGKTPVAEKIGRDTLVAITPALTAPTGPPPTTTRTAPSPAGNATGLVAEDAYTSTVQVHTRTADSDGDDQAVVTCPAASGAGFDHIPFVGPPASHPDRHHADLKLDLRGYIMTSAFLDLVSYIGPAESGAPQLAGLFQPHRGPNFKAGFQVNDWEWDTGKCGGEAYGCAGPPLTNWDVTLVALPARSGEAIFIPERSPEIYRGGYKALVLYAEERRLTLGYTREDSVANGYAVHLENLCVEPGLLALYRAQTNAAGRHVTGHLPAIRNNQAVGTAAGSHILVAIRDRGSFMDPRAKEWWQGY